MGGFKRHNWPKQAGSRADFGRPYGIVDKDNITDAQAQRLIKLKFPYIQETKSEKKASTATDKVAKAEDAPADKK